MVEEVLAVVVVVVETEEELVWADVVVVVVLVIGSVVEPETVEVDASVEESAEVELSFEVLSLNVDVSVGEAVVASGVELGKIGVGCAMIVIFG
jgi:hypothetical protein